MKKRVLISMLCAFCCFAVAALFPQISSAQDRPNVRITGTFFGIGGRFSGRTVPFTIIVNGYSSSEEQQQLKSALQSGGQEELLDVLSKMRKGRLQATGSVGVPINAVFTSPAEKGTKITIIYQRTVSFFEVRRGSRSQDYKFGYIEIFLDARGRGEGTMIPAAKIRLLDNGDWEVENFGEFPARLLGVRLNSR
jgi:hypothetical protein